MYYIVTQSLVSRDGHGIVKLWDGVTMDPDHPGQKAGILEIHYPRPAINYAIGSEVKLMVSAVTDKDRIDQRIADGAGNRLGAGI